ncbi:MAG: S8 family serine peptidase [Chloroflexi bacterium]|nr:S8 family serine peptidase [Chloroflexota bacterium]
MNKKSFLQILNLFIAFTLVLSLLLPANPTSALTGQSAPMLAGSGEPDDPDYKHASPTTPPTDQWHFHGTYGINAPDAWAITTGEASTVVAVLDTGIVPHDDLDGVLAAGYDFVSSVTNNDGNGRDPVADDPGDYGGSCTTSSWQGTHVAGIIGAASNNATGVAGIDWNADILPVRVIGTCGSVAVTDLVDGMRWAAGLTVSGVPTNLNPADVIHVSASIAGQSCTTYQAQIDAINATGAFIVAPAGDDNSTLIGFPANCDGVFTVAATESEGIRAPYSNYGSAVEISAPGGGNGHGEILSTVNAGSTFYQSISGSSIYAGKHGTAFAAAHVSGTIALMLTVNPNFADVTYDPNTYDPYEHILELLDTTATDFSGGDCAGVGEPCGSGIINAGDAIALAKLPDLVITDVALDPTEPDAGQDFDVNITVRNRGGTGSGSLVYRNVYIDTDGSNNPQLLTRTAAGCILDGGGAPYPGDYLKQDLLSSIPPGGEVTETVNILGGLLADNYQIYAYTDANCIVDESFEDNNNYPSTILSIGTIPGSFSKLSPPNTTDPMLSSSVTLDWEEAPGVAGYEYCLDTSNDQGCEGDNWISTGTDTQVDLTGLLGGTTYYWQARSLNDSGTRYADDPYPFDEVIEGWWVFETIPFPTLISPADKSSVATITPSLVVKPVDGAAQYQYQVSTDYNFTAPLVDATSTNSTYTLTALQALPYGVYYWRAKSIDGGGAPSDWSTVNQFGVTFQLLPAHNSYSTVVKPTFTWKAVASAKQYQLEVSRTLDFNVKEIEQTLNAGVVKYVAPANMDYAVHYWRMRACVGTGVPPACTWSNWTLGMKFTLTPPLSAAPALLSPATKSIVSNVGMVLTWKKVNGDDRYEVQVDNVATFLSPEVSYITPTGATSYTVTAPLTDGLYYWRVRTSNYLRVPGKWSAVRSFTLDNVPPALAPALSLPLDATTFTGTPTFSWKAVAGATLYQFQCDEDINFLSPISHSPNLKTLSYKPPMVLPVGTIIYWRVVAKDIAGNAGPWSDARVVIINAPTPAATTLTAPANALSTNVTTPVFTWNPVAYAGGYELQLANASTFAALTIKQTYSDVVPTYTATDLDDGTYYWRVRAKHYSNPAVFGAWSAARYFKVDTVAPDAPTLNLPADTAAVSVTPTFSWVKSTTGATKYQFQYATNVGFTSGVYTSAVLTALSILPKPAMTAGTYYWRVKAWDAANNESAWSAVRTLTILTAPTLSLPKNGLISNDTTPDFSWNAVTAANTYEIQISTNNTFTDVVRTSTSAARTYTPAALPHGVYYWRVRGRNIYDIPGVWSYYRVFTIDIVGPNAPVLLLPANNTAVLGNPTFKWAASTTAIKYQLQYDDNSLFGSPNYTSIELSTVSHAPNPPMAVGIFYWRVRARDALGNWGDYSSGFMVDVQPDNPPAPVLTAPANSMLTNDPTPTFTWNAVISGDTYDIEIASDIAFTTIDDSDTGLSSTTFTPVSSLSEGLHYWQVRARNTLGTIGPWSAVRSFTVDITAPDSPALSLPADLSTVVGTPTFKWLASATAVKYRFQYDDSSGFGSPNYTSGELTTASHLPPTMTPGTYYWRVQARDLAGNWSPYSAYFTITINPPTPVAPVLTAPAAIPTNDNTPTFTWNAVGAAPYTYTYEFQLASASTFAVDKLVQTPFASSDRTYTANPLLLDGIYYWRVRAINSISTPGPWSVARSFTVDTQIPSVPVLNLPADAASVNGTPTFSWLKSTTGATKYQFQYDDDAGFGTPYTSAVLTVLAIKPPTMSIGTYNWRVKAWDAAGNETDWSAVRTVTVTPLAPTGIPVLDAPINGTIVYDTTPTVKWKAVAGAAKYRVQMDGNSTFSSPEFNGTTAGATLELAPTTPLANGVYYWRVRKIDIYGGEGAWSVVRRLSINEVIPLAVTQLSGLSALAAFDTSTPTLSWDSVEHGVMYQVQVDNNTGFSTLFFDDTADTTSRVVSTPLANGEYFWRVRAINEYGTPGPWSEIWTFTVDVPTATP